MVAKGKSIKKGKIPLYLGISIHYESRLEEKVKYLMVDALSKISEKFNTSSVRDNL